MARVAAKCIGCHGVEAGDDFINFLLKDYQHWPSAEEIQSQSGDADPGLLEQLHSLMFEYKYDRRKPYPATLFLPMIMLCGHRGRPRGRGKSGDHIARVFLEGRWQDFYNCSRAINRAFNKQSGDAAQQYIDASGGSEGDHQYIEAASGSEDDRQYIEAASGSEDEMNSKFMGASQGQYVLEQPVGHHALGLEKLGVGQGIAQVGVVHDDGSAWSLVSVLLEDCDEDVSLDDPGSYGKPFDVDQLLVCQLPEEDGLLEVDQPLVDLQELHRMINGTLPF